MIARRTAPLWAAVLCLAAASFWFLGGDAQPAREGISRAEQRQAATNAGELEEGDEASESSDQRSSASAAPQAGLDQTAGAGIGPLVISATGLSLAQVELAQPGGAWELLGLVEGRLPFAAGEEGLRIRSAGHLTMFVGAGDEVVELSPAATLTLHGAGARERIGKLRLAADRPEPERWLFAGSRRADFVDDDTWVLSLVPDEDWKELVCEFELDGETLLRVESWPARGVNLSVPLPPPAELAERLPFEVEVTGAASPVSLDLDAEERLARGVLRGDQGERLGTWEHLADAGATERTSADGHFQLPGYPSGRRFYVRAAAPAEGSEAAHTYTSSGERIVLELHGGRVLRGRLAANRGELPRSVDLSWRFTRSSGSQSKRMRLQGSSAESVPVDRAGRFELGVPDDPMWAGFDEGPDELRVSLRCAGFDEARALVKLVEGREDYDLGVVTLEKRTPEFLLMPPHPTLKRPLMHSEEVASILCTPRLPEVRHWVSSVHEVDAVGGLRYQVYLQRMLTPAGHAKYEVGRLRYTWKGIDPLTPEALVLVQDGADYPYVRASNGYYQGVDCSLREVELALDALPEGVTRVELAWVWRELIVPIERYGAGDLKSDEVGDLVEFQVWAPRDGVQLSLQYATNNANDGSPSRIGEPRLVPLTEGKIELRLP